MRFEIHHPSTVLDEKVTSQIRETSLEAETLRRLHNDQLEIIYREKYFKMFVPQEYGGLGLSLPEILKIEESLSWADGSTGWVVTLCSGAAWFIGFLNSEIVDELVTNDLLCIAGSGALTGAAEVTNNGFLINGVWRYASGALHATSFTINCYIKKDNQQLYNPDGSPMVSSFILKKEDVELLQTWNSMGMIATGSHSFKINNLYLPLNRSFKVDANRSILKGSIYRYPFLQLAEATLAVTISGMATRFVDLTEILFRKKNNDKSGNAEALAKIIFEVQTELNRSRGLFFSAIAVSWKELIIKNQLTNHTQSSVSELSRNLVLVSRELVNKLYPLCGLVATESEKEINRVWRNIHTAGQHSLFR